MSLTHRRMLIGLVLAVGLPILGLGMHLAAAQTATPAASATASSAACPAATPASGAVAADCVVIGMYDIYFKPNHENSGLENLNIVVDVPPGQTGETTIDAPEGDYYFFCDEPGHEAAGMRGYISVKKDADITTAEATVTPRAG